MGCFSPLAMQRSKIANENGKRQMTFSVQEGDGEWVELPCGVCDGCRADQARDWSIRMYHESQMHAQCSFLTLTYADRVIKDNVCLIAPKVLVKKDLQDFIKRLRLKYKFRYFACGEYGEETRRPHYHMIVFGQDFLTEAVHGSDGQYSNLIVERAWGHGHVVIGDAKPEAMSYVAGYCAKKIGDSDTFNIASNVPPLGYDWFVKFYSDITRTGTVVFGDCEFPIPKAYFRFDCSKFCPIDGSNLDSVKDDRREFARKKGFSDLRHLESKHLLSVSKRKLKKETI